MVQKQTIQRKWFWCAIMVWLPGLIILTPLTAGAEVFDWRDIDGKDFTTPVKDQGACGSCGAFASVASLESKLEITLNNPDLNPDLSEQHLLCDDDCVLSCAGGTAYHAMLFFRDVGIVNEAELPYCASNTSPNWPLATGWENRVCKITERDHVPAISTGNVKDLLKEEGPLAMGMIVSSFFWPDDNGPPVYGSGGHCVLIVGFHDDDTLDEGGYWIVKNSWGDDWGPDGGYGYILYGGLNENLGCVSVSIITGDAYIVPEPATLSLLAISGLTLVLRRRRR